ncbi:tetratricopeptide repeat protein [Thermosulfurimonas marina]|uniref:tetratricopeptide repeat protein n=1 Tax=Thermosulfurimonas marina TaxID=2047767 RepID=UPI00144AF101|nr:tetratricopeptide repeat protein [Thermosulfurimonas marina]
MEKEASSPPPLSPEERLRGLLTRAEALRTQGRCEEALDLYRQYLEKRPVPEVMNNYAACLWLAGKTKEAEEWFRKSLSLKEDAEVRLNLVLLALARGDEKGACQELKLLDPEKLSASPREIYRRVKNRVICPP